MNISAASSSAAFLTDTLLFEGCSNWCQAVSALLIASETALHLPGPSDESTREHCQWEQGCMRQNSWAILETVPMRLAPHLIALEWNQMIFRLYQNWLIKAYREMDGADAMKECRKWFPRSKARSLDIRYRKVCEESIVIAQTRQLVLHAVSVTSVSEHLWCE